MDTIATNDQQQVRSVADLMQEIKTPTPAATDTAKPATEPQPGTQPDTPQPAQPAQPAPNPEPIFKPADAEPEPKRKSEKEVLEEAELSAKMFLEFRQWLQSELFSKIAKTKDKDKYKWTEEQFDMLAKAWLPMAKKWGGTIPDWAYLVAYEVMFTGSMIYSAIDERREHNRQEDLKHTEPVKQAFQQAAQAGAKKERTTWTIDNQGYYTKDVYGTYIPKAERKEKASLELVVQLVESNGTELVMRAFEIDENYLRNNGVPAVG